MTTAGSSTPSSDKTITEYELEQCQRANQTGRPPVVFVHGLWLLPSSWDRWAKLFEDNGYVALTPGWPDDPETVEDAAEHPEVFAGKSIGQIARPLRDRHPRARQEAGDHRPLHWRVVDPDPGRAGLGRGVGGDRPGPFRGVLPLPISTLKSSSPVLRNPANRARAVPLTYDQFRYGFANAVSEEEAKQLYEDFAVPASGKALWQAALANLNPWTEDKVDTKNPERGPLLLISGERDHTVPPAIVNASYKQQQYNPGVTEIETIPGHGHALIIDNAGVR